MKRLTALLLALLLFLSAVPALAEEGLNIRQLPQKRYVSSVLIAPEAYPEVCIAPYAEYQLLGSSNRVEQPTFLCFPGPKGVYPCEFDIDYAKYMDPDHTTIYSYQVKEKDTFEDFLSKAKQDEYIILDGSDGVAAYINPEGKCAYGMNSAEAFWKTAMLRITIDGCDLNSCEPLDIKARVLTEATLKEVARVKAEMRYETLSSFWSVGKYGGIRFLDVYDLDYTLNVAFPAMACAMPDGGNVEADMIVTKVDDSRLEGVYDFGNGQYVEVTITIETNSYARTQLETSKEATEITLPNGNTWYLYMSGLIKDGKSSYVNASTLLNHTDYNGKEMYFNVALSGRGGVVWSSFEQLAEEVAVFDANIQASRYSDDPYIPAAEESSASDEALAELQNKLAELEAYKADAQDTIAELQSSQAALQEQLASMRGSLADAQMTLKDTESKLYDAQAELDAFKAKGWICPDCGEFNTGKFCSECSAAKPEN